MGFAFAAPIRAGVAAAFGIDDDYFYDRKLKEKPIDGIGKSVRELTQLFGTEFGRNMIDPDIWVNVANTMYQGAKNAPEYAGTYQGIAISDVRFENEAKWIHDNGGVVIKITRPGVGPVNGHVSDKGLSDEHIDYVIENDGTLDQFHEKVLNTVQAVIAQQ